MSNNNFLKIRIFNLEQNLKQTAEKQITFTKKMIKEIGTIQDKLLDRDYPDRASVMINLEAYKGCLKYIESNNKDLFRYIEDLYKGKDTPKPKTPRKKKIQQK